MKETLTQKKVREKKVQEVKEGLQSGKEAVILKALEDLKKYGDLSVIPLLIELVIEHEQGPVSEQVRDLMVNIKGSDIISPVMNALRQNIDDAVKSFLLSVIWETGQDAYPYISEIIEIALNGSSMTVIEAMTVIENIDENKDPAPFNDALVMLKSEIKKNEGRFMPDKVRTLEALAQVLTEKLIGQ